MQHDFLIRQFPESSNLEETSYVFFDVPNKTEEQLS